MEAIRQTEEELDRWSTDRVSDVGPVNLVIRLWSRAWDLHEHGDHAEALEAALDATVVWSLDPTSLDEDVMVELLETVCGVQASAILDAVRFCPALAAWEVGGIVFPREPDVPTMSPPR